MILDQDDPFTIIAEHPPVLPRREVDVDLQTAAGEWVNCRYLDPFLSRSASKINSEIDRIGDGDVNVAKLNIAEKRKRFEREGVVEEALKQWLKRRAGERAELTVPFAFDL